MRAHVLVFEAVLCLAPVCAFATAAAAASDKPSEQKQPASHIFCDLRSCRVIKTAPEEKHTPPDHAASADDQRHQSASPPH